MTSPAAVRWPGMAAALLVAWCVFLGARYAVTWQPGLGVLAVLAPWWPADFRAAAPMIALIVATLAAWMAMREAAVRRTWFRLLVAMGGSVAAWVAWHSARGPVATGVFGTDGVRIAAAVLATVALLPLVAEAAALVRRATPAVPPAAWCAAVILAITFGTTARPEIAATLAVNLVAWGFGAWLLARVAPGERALGIDLALSWLLGWVVLGLIAMALGWMGWWHRGVAAGVLLGLVVIARRAFVTGLRRVWHARGAGGFRPAEGHVLAFAAVMMATTLVASLAPEVYADATGHHVALADRMAREHRLAFWPQWNGSVQINQGPMLFAWGTLFSTHVAAKLQNFLFALSVPLTMLAFARRWLAPAAGPWAAGIWASSSLAIWLATTGYVDCIAAAYTLGAVIALLIWIEDGAPGQALLAGIFAGALMATKFASYTFVIPLGALVVVTAVLRARGRWRSGVVPVAAFAAATLAVCLPWFVRAFVLTGNPVFPVFNHVFRSPYWESDNALGGFNLLFGSQRAPSAVVRLPWTMAFEPEKLVEVGGIGPLLLALLPLAALARNWGRPLRTLAVLALLSTALWIVGIPYLRWFISLLPLWALIAGGLLASLEERLRPLARNVVGAAVFTLMLVSIGTDVVGRAWWYRGVSEPGLPWRVARGIESRAEYLRRTVLGYEAVEHLAATAPRARVFSPSFRDHLYQETLMDGGPTAVLQTRQALDRALWAGTPGNSWMHMRGMGYEYFLADGRNHRFNGSWFPRARLYRREFLSQYTRLEFVGNGAYVFRILPAPHPDPRWPEPGTIGNGGFEALDSAGQPAGWARRGDVAVDVTEARARSGSVSVVVGGGGSGGDGALSKRIPVASAPFLVLTLFARGTTRTNDRFVEIEWRAADGSVVGLRRLSFWPGRAWDEFFFADRRPPAATSAVVTIAARTPVWIDDVYAHPPAPADAPSTTLVPALAFHRAAEGRFYLRNANRSDGHDLAVQFGAPGDLPLMGDWDGDGVVTIGVFRPREATFHLRNRNTPGPADVTVAFGMAGDLPVVGDWDGDGTTTVGVYRASESSFHLRNANSAGPPDVTVAFGHPQERYVPLAGDWDGDGTSTVGLFSDHAQFALRATNAGGPSDVTGGFGVAGDFPVTGDWDGDGDDTIAVYRADGTFFMRNENSSGPADATMTLAPGDTVVPGSSRVVVPRAP